MQLVTGGTGFIGRRLCAALDPTSLRILNRTAQAANAVAIDLANAEMKALIAACDGVDTVYHCAGHAHAWGERDSKSANRHWQINFEGTSKLVEAAGQSGVRRFIFLSSVKAAGESGRRCVDEEWPAPPTTSYGQAKRAAEEAVLEAGAKYGMHAVNLRPAMVYGSGGHGNLERMVRMISAGWFPPLPETKNKRSLVHVDDVVSAIECVAQREEASGKTYIIADQIAYSGRELYDHIRAALALKPVTFSMPIASLRSLARCGDTLEFVVKHRPPFNSDALNKLLDWACYSPDRIRRELGWRAQISLAQGLAELIGPQ